MADCGGCAGMGAHRRWCPWVVGAQASLLGRLSQRAEDLGDEIGPNEFAAANHAWAAAALLRARAEQLAGQYPGVRRDGSAPVAPPSL